MAIHYWVVVKKSPTELADEVSRLLAEGWTLQGGVSVSTQPEDLDGTYAPQYGRFTAKLAGTATMFAQALVLEQA